MKKWLKGNGRWIVIGLGVLFIANSSYGFAVADEDWKMMFHTVAIVIWLLVIYLYIRVCYPGSLSGGRISEWDNPK